MATITITIPDNIKDRVINAVANLYKYQAELVQGDGTTIPNPETKAVFAKKVVIGFLKEVTKTSEANKAAETARVQAVNSAESEITLS